ncbi:24426_t:CDS:2, partial [Gigaspora margarita]
IANENELALLKEFQSADTIIPTLLTLPNYPKEELTSKLLSFKDLSNPINSSFISSAKLPKSYDSATCNIDFPVSDNSYENTSQKDIENRIQNLEKQSEEYKKQLKKMEEESKKKHETMRRQIEHLKEILKALAEKSE